MAILDFDIAKASWHIAVAASSWLAKWPSVSIALKANLSMGKYIKVM
jgi:hypothetical protein